MRQHGRTLYSRLFATITTLTTARAPTETVHTRKGHAPIAGFLGAEFLVF